MGDLVVGSSEGVVVSVVGSGVGSVVDSVLGSVVDSVVSSVVDSFLDSFVGSVARETDDEDIITTEVLLGKTALTSGVALLMTEDENENM